MNANRRRIGASPSAIDRSAVCIVPMMNTFSGRLIDSVTSDRGLEASQF
jgi:hypothetical protein